MKVHHYNRLRPDIVRAFERTMRNSRPRATKVEVSGVAHAYRPVGYVQPTGARKSIQLKGKRRVVY